MKNAEAKVAECKSSAGYAELSYTRHLKLVESRAVSQDAVDNALSARDSARAALAAANADLTVARDNLKHCRITAPISGQIGTTAFTRGNYVTTSSGTLVTLIQMKPIRVRFAISNREYLDLFNGSERRFIEEGKIALTLANGSEFGEDGQIEYVENAADELTDTVMAYALFPNAERKLKTGGTVTGLRALPERGAQAQDGRHRHRHAHVPEGRDASGDPAHGRAAGHAGPLRVGGRRGRRRRAALHRARRPAG